MNGDVVVSNSGTSSTAKFVNVQVRDARLERSDDYVAKPVDFLMTHLIEIPEFEKKRPPGFASSDLILIGFELIVMTLCPAHNCNS